MGTNKADTIYCREKKKSSKTIDGDEVVLFIYV